MTSAASLHGAALARLTRAAPLVLVVALASATAGAAEPPPPGPARRVAIVIDTSGSMQTSDKPRYTVLLSEIIADLLAPTDRLTVVRLPNHPESCSAGPDPSLAVSLHVGARSAFQGALDALVRYGGGNVFASPIRTATHALGNDATEPRMLLMLADSGGLDQCTAPLTRDLGELRKTGAMIAAINLGATAGAFDNDPSFEFTTAAPDAEHLMRAVALVYQKFLGSSRVQTGPAGATFSIEVHQRVAEAFLVTAADGSIEPLRSDVGNPHAETIDANFNGGGSVAGLDGIKRSYRILRLQRPAAGTWTFHTASLGPSAGYMYLEVSSLALRRVDHDAVTVGREAAMALELYDTTDGKAIRDPATLKDLKLRLASEGGASTAIRDDGAGSDAHAGDGIYTFAHTSREPGRRVLDVHLTGSDLDRRFPIVVDAVSADWQLVPNVPPRVHVEEPAKIAVTVRPTLAGRVPASHPRRLLVTTDGGTVELRDDGQGDDEHAGDDIYSSHWTPVRIGTVTLRIAADGGGVTSPVTVSIAAVPVLRFGPIPKIVIGPVKSGQQGHGELDLSAATIRGPHELHVSAGFASAGAALDIMTGSGWTLLRPDGVSLRVDSAHLRHALRLRVGSCPAACRPEAPYSLTIAATDGDGQPIRTTVAVAIQVIPDPFLQCWWWALAAALGLIGSLILIYGYWSPARFPPRLGVLIAAEDDIEGGYLRAIRSVRGTGVRLYRDARVFIRADHRLSGRANNAVAVLRADSPHVCIRPVGRSSLQRQSDDGEWQDVPDDETVVRFGQLFRTGNKALYFEVRNRKRETGDAR